MELRLGAAPESTASPGFEAGSGVRLVPAGRIRGFCPLYSRVAVLYSTEGLSWTSGRCCSAFSLSLSSASLLQHWACACSWDCLCLYAPFLGVSFSFRHIRGSFCSVFSQACAWDSGLASLLLSVRGRRVPNTCIGGSGTRTALPSLWTFFEDPSSVATGCVVALRVGLHCNLPLNPFGFSSRKPLGFLCSCYGPWPACCCAPNTCIGGAGTRAFSSVAPSSRAPLPFWLEVLQRLLFDGFMSSWWHLGGISTACLAFFRSLLVLVGVSLLSALLAATPFRGTTVGRRSLGCVPSVLCFLLRAFAVASPAVAVCDWHPPRRPGNLRRARQQRCAGGFLGKALIWLIGFCSCPRTVWAMPPALRLLCSLAETPHTDVHTPDTSSHTAEVDAHPLRPDDLDAPPVSGFRFVSAPLPGTMPTTFNMPPALGVTIHAPRFMPTFFGLQVPDGASVQDVLHAAVSLGKLPHPALDTVIPVTNQRFDTAMSFLAYPSCISMLDPPHCAVILDLTRVGGHYHAAALPCALSRHALFEHIETLIWHDTCEVEVWVDGAEFPASHGLLAFAHGSVLTVLLRGHRPSRFVAPSDILRPPTAWGPFEQSPSPRRQVGEAFVNSRGVVKLRYNLLSPYSPESSIRRALDLGPLDFLMHTEQHMRLDVHGDYCHSVFAGPSSARPWLLDMRLIGHSVRAFFGGAEPLC